MPRVKIVYVVSFSSEDPENRAENLLSLEVNKKKWLCSHWESSCSVVLQLERAVEISSIQIGAYNAALIEVLIGLSERPNDPFQVLVPSCVFMSPAEARRGASAERVRSFARDQLAVHARADRLRVVCSQPYNKHCKYGLSFVHINEAEAPLVSRLSAALATTDAPSSDEDEFRPGELFARRMNTSTPSSGNTTSAQIRQATSQALKNVPDSSTKLLKTQINTPNPNQQKKTDDVHTDRRRDALIYTDDDDKPHDKIDRIVNRHNDEKTKKDEPNKTKNVEKDKGKEKLGSNKEHGNAKKDGDHDVRDSNKNNRDVPSRDKAVHTETNKDRDSVRNREKEVTKAHDKKQSHDRNEETGLQAGPVCAEREVLRGVRVALSGYAGARRAALRSLALRLGATYCADWTPACTHLVCAFPNTPKLRAARAASRSVGVATDAWLEACAARRRRLPWQWFATVPAERRAMPPLDAPPPQTNKRDLDDDEDTDDEIEKHLNAKRARNKSPSPAGSEAAGGVANMSSDSDVAFVRDERFRGHVTIDSDDDNDGAQTDRDGASAPAHERIDPSKTLPDFFDGYTFAILDEVAEKYDIDLLTRYIRAYGGLVIQSSEEQDGEVDFVVGGERRGGRGAGRGGRGTGRPPRWVWACHRAGRLLPAGGPEQVDD